MRLRPAWLIALAALGVLCVVEYWNFNGLCYGERRYLGDRELMTAAIAKAIDDDRRHADRIQYASPEAFVRENPDCCRLFREGHWILPEDIWVRFFGWYVAVAEVFYRIKPQGADAYHRLYVSLDACGKVLQRDSFLDAVPPRH